MTTRPAGPTGTGWKTVSELRSSGFDTLTAALDASLAGGVDDAPFGEEGAPRLTLEGAPLRLLAPIAEGGEGAVWRAETGSGAGLQKFAVKLFHDPSPEREAKLAAMRESPPADPSLVHRSLAWPQGLVRDASGAFAGYAMDDLSDTKSLNAFYNAKLRKRQSGVNWYGLHALAAGIAHLFDALHGQDIVIGDIRPDNFRVHGHALVTLIDTDSLALPRPAAGSGKKRGKTSGTLRARWPCAVGSEGFTAPELIRRNLAKAERCETQDRYGLAVLIFLLLTGRHPFSGAWEGFGEAPTLDRLIELGLWPYGPTRKIVPGRLALPLSVHHPAVCELFERCFITGHAEPAARPTAREWVRGLCEAMADLVSCEHRRGHFHFAGRPCPWCLRADEFGHDAFPEGAAAADPLYPLILAFERALARGDGELAAQLWAENASLRKHPETRGRKRVVEKVRGAAEEQGSLEGI